MTTTNGTALARRYNAELFISVHADSFPQDRGVSGATIYTLSETASDAEAERLARRENRSDVIAGVDLGREDDDVTSILIDLAQRPSAGQIGPLGELPALRGVRQGQDHPRPAAGTRRPK